MMKPHVVVIGGGFAGASAASALAEAGISVTLLEKRAVLGGRASSLKDGVTKEDMDNGQHLFMGCYKETRRFLKRLKVEDRLRFLKKLEIPFLTPKGGAVLSASNWPFSMGVLLGLFGFNALSGRDKWSLLKGLTAAHFSKGKGLELITVGGWLDRLKQTPGARRAFWAPLCLATLNASPETACAAALYVVLRDGLFAGNAERALGYSTVSLGKLWSPELQGYMKARGGALATEQSVTGLEVREGQVSRVRLEGGDSGEVDAVVCAVPLPSFLSICPEDIRPRYEPLKAVDFSPILSVNFWFDRPVWNGLFAGCLDTDVQWIFNRGSLWGKGGASEGYISLVLSDARSSASFSSAEVIDRALADLRRLLPDVPAPRHATVVWERQATPAPTPAFWAARPPTATPIPNLFLAGDWVDTGLPPTIEAACKSGHAAAAAVEAYLNKTPSKETVSC
jgi:hydroxysqualene dehydroxylase